MLLFRFFWFLIDLGISDDHLSVWHYIPKHSTKRGAIDRKWLLSGVRERYIYLHIYCWVFIIGFFSFLTVQYVVISVWRKKKKEKIPPERESEREIYWAFMQTTPWRVNDERLILYSLWTNSNKKKKSVFLVGCQSHHLALPDSNVYI